MNPKIHVLGECHMFSCNASCFRATSRVSRQCLMFSGNASCFRAISNVFRQCLVFSGSVACFRATSHVYGQCPMLSGNTHLVFSGNARLMFSCMVEFAGSGCRWRIADCRCGLRIVTKTLFWKTLMLIQWFTHFLKL